MFPLVVCWLGPLPSVVGWLRWPAAIRCTPEYAGLIGRGPLRGEMKLEIWEGVELTLHTAVERGLSNKKERGEGEQRSTPLPPSELVSLVPLGLAGHCPLGLVGLLTRKGRP